MGVPSTPSMWNASPPGPSTLRNQTVLGSSPLFEEKERSDPSGDQDGEEDSAVGSVIRNASPSGRPLLRGCSQISWCRVFSSSTTVVTVNATKSPEGAIATWDTVTRL